MSAFNLARYNAARFNINPTSDIWLISTARTSFSFSYAGITNYAKGNSAVLFLADQLSLDAGKFMSGSAQMTVSGQSLANCYFWQVTTADTTFTEEINLSQEAFLIAADSTVIDAESNISQEVSAIGTEMTTITAAVNCSQKAFVIGDAGEVFSQTADVISLTRSVCSFPNLILRPGQTLIVDSGSYNVMLDGQNAIYLQEGDWLDNLSRDTIDITVSATGVSRLQIQVIYIERYL